MSEVWLRDYTLLAFRLHKVVEATYASPFVEDYWGPPAWRQQVEGEAEVAVADLVRQAEMLAETLPEQRFEPNRTIYLDKQLRAMEALARKLCGETFRLAEEVERVFDIHPVWVPETQFEEAHAIYESVVPGTGDLAQRLPIYRAQLAFPQGQSDLLKDVIEQAFAEVRKRTRALLALPEAETIEIAYFPEKEYDASARYQGNYRTRVEMNLASTAAWFSRLFDHKVCHEGYPGHHTEYILKDQHLLRQRGFTEMAMYLTRVPQCVISEGIAMVAHEMIFSEGEAELWIADQMRRLLHKDVDATMLLRLRQASEILNGVWGNAAILLDEGHTEAEVAQYMVRYMLLSEETAIRYVTSLKHPFYGLYQLIYGAGQRLLRSWLKGPDRVAVFHRFLTEQWTPSQLEKTSIR